jgi:predicted DNA-binding protein with PD1-like motif
MAGCGTAHGGHLIDVPVRTTGEVVLTQSPAHLQRIVDAESDPALICPEETMP